MGVRLQPRRPASSFGAWPGKEQQAETQRLSAGAVRDALWSAFVVGLGTMFVMIVLVYIVPKLIWKAAPSPRERLADGVERLLALATERAGLSELVPCDVAAEMGRGAERLRAGLQGQIPPDAVPPEIPWDDADLADPKRSQSPEEQG